jgi:hypothetical protein
MTAKALRYTLLRGSVINRSLEEVRDATVQVVPLQDAKAEN